MAGELHPAGSSRSTSTAPSSPTCRPPGTSRRSISPRRSVDAVRRAYDAGLPRRARDRAARPSASPASGTCSACREDGDTGAVRGQQRVGDVPLPAGRGARDGHLRRRARSCGCCSSTCRTPRSRSRRSASATGSTGPSPTARSPGEMLLQTRRGARRRAGHPRDHPRPALLGGGVPRARREARPARHQLLHRLDRLARHRARGVSKASALGEVAAELGVDQADVLAIGDGRNDIEMLRWAGRGVAMGQAPLEVQEAADDVTETVDRGRRRRRARALVLSA